MKMIYLTLALVLSSQIFAATVDEFCGSFTWENDKIECYKTAGRNFINQDALDICNNLSFDNDKMGCLRSILNKDYTPGEVNTCKDQSFDSDKVKCLVQLGANTYPPTDGRKLETIKKLTITAQDFLRRNDVIGASKVLDQILFQTTHP